MANHQYKTLALLNIITLGVIMFKSNKLMLIAGVLLLTTGFAQAESERGAPPERPTFSSLDLNSDGEVSFEEFSSHDVPRGDHETIFGHIDTDSDGIITSDEFENHKPPQRKDTRR